MTMMRKRTIERDKRGGAKGGFRLIRFVLSFSRSCYLFLHYYATHYRSYRTRTERRVGANREESSACRESRSQGFTSCAFARSRLTFPLASLAITAIHTATMLRPTSLLPLRAAPSPFRSVPHISRSFSTSPASHGAIKSVGVIGSGQMGVGIAYVAARVRSHPSS